MQLLNGSLKLMAQVTADFNLPLEVCLEERFSLENTSTDAINYEWDFCSYDNLGSVPQTQLLGANNYGSPFNIKLVENNGLFYAFIAGRTTNKIYRLDFGDNLQNTPVYNDLDGTSVLVNPSGIDIVLIAGNWYGLVTGYSSNKLYLLEFGNSLESIPLVSDISSGLNLSLPMDVKIAIDDGEIYAFVVNNASGQYPYLRLNFGVDLTSSPVVDEFIVTGANALTSIDIKRDNSDWYGFLVSRNNQRLYRINFGSSISNAPSYSDVSTPTNIGMNDPGGLKIVQEIDSAYVFVQSRNGPLYKFHFGANYSSAPSALNLGNIYSANRTWGLDFVKANSNWVGFNANFNNKIYRIDFPSNCNLLNPTSVEESPTLTFSQPGETLISLKAINSGQSTSNITKLLTITSEVAPTGEIMLRSAYCITDDISFLLDSPDEIVSYNWNFGDGNTSSDISPTHQYSTDGEFDISLQVESVAGCPNTFYTMVSILPEPQPGFTTTSTEYCTFEPIDFSNITSFNFGSNIAWYWDFNGEGSSTEDNPNFTFESQGTKIITLEANVLGCVQTYESTLLIIEGPEVDFNFGSTCLGESVQFTNLSSGSNITSYLWDFGNGASSALENPQITYNSPGSYEVVLTVTNASGCENTTIQSVQIFEQVVDSIYSTEAIENLSFSFWIDWNNDFDSTQILGYQWEIEGEIQTTDTATYRLDEGNYSINLQITTENNCVFTTIRAFEVKASERPVPNFYLPQEVCLGQQFQLENASINADTYEWDFCTSDLSEMPKNGIESLDLDINNSIAFRLIKSGNDYYGFTFDFNTNSLYRLDFGENPSSVPSIINLGNIDGLFTSPIAIDFIKENNDWYGLVANTGADDITKLSFGSSLSNTPTGVSLTNFSTIINPEGLMISQYSDTITAFVLNGTKITRLNFGNSINNTATASNISVPNSNRLWDLDIIEDNGNYFGVLSSFGNSNVYYLEFGSDLLSVPSIQQFDVSSLNLISPSGLQLIKDDENFYSFIQYRSGDLVRFAFGASMVQTPSMENLGTVDIIPTTNNSNVQLVKDSSKWIGFTMNFGQSKLLKYDFENICSTPSSYSNNSSPTLSFSSPGTYPITLTATHPNGSKASITKEITVTNNIAPELSITSSSIEACIGNAITFEGTSPEAITNWQWSFGNGDSAFVQSPTYSFDTPGTYQIITEGISDNGCKNLAIQEVTIYEPPVVSFSKSTQGTFCSQKPIDFFNTTSLPTNATFSWDFGDGTTSTEENPSHTFAAAGEYTINLDVEMAGCLSSTSQLITVNPGPSLSFSTTNTCFGQSIEFTNNSSGDFISSYQWDFGDGTTSTQENPLHTFDATGEKTIRLTALSTNGCDYTFETIVNVFPLAHVDFEVEPACAGKTVQFLESVSIANANIVDYLWDFGLSGSNADFSTEANPTFSYSQAGNYAVDLQVVTEDGCVTNLTKTIVVAESPQPLISIGEACIDQAVSFSGNEDASINTHFWQITDSTNRVVYTNTNANFNYLFPYAGNFNISYRQENQNVCSNVTNKTFKVLRKPAPFFSMSKACLGEPISFQENTSLNDNIIVQYHWLLDNDVFSSNRTPSLLIQQAGEYTVSLEVETASGCLVTYTEQLMIKEAPAPAFELAQTLAASPYELSTSTTLLAGETSNWYVNDELISSEADLSTTLDKIGVYLIGLEIINEEGCSTRINKQISIKAPQLNISISNLRAIEEIDYTSFILSIANTGTLVPDYYNLNLTIGDFSVSEKLAVSILPGEISNQALTVRLSENQLKGVDRICVEAVAVNLDFKEAFTNDNRSCINLIDEFKVLNVFPNPVREKVTIPIIMPNSAMIEVNIEMANGQSAMQEMHSLEKGYNEVKLNVDAYKAGIYFIKIRYQNELVVKKVVFN